MDANFLDLSTTRLARWLETVLAGLSLAALVLGLWLAVDAWHLRRSRPLLQAALAQEAPAPAQPLAGQPSPADLAGLRQGLQALKGLGLRPGLGCSSLLAKLERLLPAPAYLVRLEQDQEKGQVDLAAESREAEVLARFLQALEADADFSKVLLVKQERQQSGDKAVTRYTLQAQEAGR